MLQFLTPKLIQNWTWKMFYFDFSQWHNLNTGGSSGPAVGELRLNVVAMEFWTKGSGLRTSLYPITAIKSELKTHISNMYHHIVSVDMKLQHDPRLCSCTYMCMSTHIRTHTRLTGSIACTCNRHNFKAEQGQGFSSVRKPRVLTSRTSLSYIMKTICELSPAKKKEKEKKQHHETSGAAVFVSKLIVVFSFFTLDEKIIRGGLSSCVRGLGKWDIMSHSRPDVRVSDECPSLDENTQISNKVITLSLNPLWKHKVTFSGLWTVKLWFKRQEICYQT